MNERAIMRCESELLKCGFPPSSSPRPFLSSPFSSKVTNRKQAEGVTGASSTGGAATGGRRQSVGRRVVSSSSSGRGGSREASGGGGSRSGRSASGTAMPAAFQAARQKSKEKAGPTTGTNAAKVGCSSREC